MRQLRETGNSQVTMASVARIFFTIEVTMTRAPAFFFITKVIMASATTEEQNVCYNGDRC